MKNKRNSVKRNVTNYGTLRTSAKRRKNPNIGLQFREELINAFYEGNVYYFSNALA